MGVKRLVDDLERGQGLDRGGVQFRRGTFRCAIPQVRSGVLGIQPGTRSNL